MHIAEAFKIIQIDGYNILSNFSQKDFKLIRSSIISVVLATDMKTHFKKLVDFNSAPEHSNLNLLEMALHCADVSNACKPSHLYTEWASRVMSEFYIQGDNEKKNGVSHTWSP